MNTTMRALSVLLCCCLLFISPPSCAGATADRNLEVEQFLASLNKPFVKSISVPDGDIIDCVHVLQQPAFDHPLLRNHVIQMSPTSYPNGMNESSVEGEIAQEWEKYGTCPTGTVPILRTSREDVLRAGSTEAYGKKPPNSSIPDAARLNAVSSTYEYAMAFSRDGSYRGANAEINVWNPHVQGQEEYSSGQLWLIARSDEDDVEAIEAGMHVHPKLYGDDRTRLFIHWTVDPLQRTGCYNLKCSGFVQINSKVALGGQLHPVSTYDGAQYFFSLNIWRDARTRNWWLKFQNYVVGYWPATLFDKFPTEATSVEWGGEVLASGTGDEQHTTTQMGSGHFPTEGHSRAAYIRKLEIVDKSDKVQPYKYQDLDLRTYDNLCYDVKSGYSNTFQNHIYFGGPGRNPKSP